LNILLFEADELERVLPLGDRRAGHLREVLKRGPGESFDAGIVNGPQGKGRVERIRAEGIEWSFMPQPAAPAELDPIELWVGLPRPQTARKILQEGAALGVRAMRFVVSDKAERGYAQSTLWSSGEWRRHALAGVEQSFSTRLPVVEFGVGLAETLAANSIKTLVALDNYEAKLGLADPAAFPVEAPAVVLIGAERGWSAAERELLRKNGAILAHLGRRVLRTETACVAAISLIKARLGGFR
jgi:16S rRNA (uracil1498-N3)-methyltransferase